MSTLPRGRARAAKKVGNTYMHIFPLLAYCLANTAHKGHTGVLPFRLCNFRSGENLQ